DVNGLVIATSFVGYRITTSARHSKAHAGVLAGHFCVMKVFSQLRNKHSEMMKHIDTWTRECKTCLLAIPK
ncbi:hypothetical protein V3C99_008298, partial [Haemonchus contortus]|uniref:Transposase n=1 Tax=Haemonchus contortus TaxID=6289 RepID=A0A7I4YLD9_HAECO